AGRTRVEGGGIPAGSAADDDDVEALLDPFPSVDSPRGRLLRCHLGCRGNHLHQVVAPSAGDGASLPGRRIPRPPVGCGNRPDPKTSEDAPVVKSGQAPSGLRPHAEIIGDVATSSSPEARAARYRSISSAVAIASVTSRSRVCSTVARSNTVQDGEVIGK